MSDWIDIEDSRSVCKGGVLYIPSTGDELRILDVDYDKGKMLVERIPFSPTHKNQPKSTWREPAS